MGKVSGLWCPVGDRKRRVIADQPVTWPVKGHWVKTWTVHDMNSATPDMPLAVGSIDGIVLSEEIFGPVMDILETAGLLMDLPERTWAKCAKWRHADPEDDGRLKA